MIAVMVSTSTALPGLTDFLSTLAIVAAVKAHDVSTYKALTGKSYTDFCSLENYVNPLPFPAYRPVGHWRWQEGTRTPYYTKR